MLLATVLTREAIIHPMTILLHHSQHFESTDPEDGLGAVQSMKLILFFVVRPIIMDRLQSRYPVPSKGVETSLIPAWSEG